MWARGFALKLKLLLLDELGGEQRARAIFVLAIE